jgi:hypothetical protein
VAQGRLDEALKAYRDNVGIAERLASADGSNTRWQRGLWVSYNKVGDVLVPTFATAIASSARPISSALGQCWNTDHLAEQKDHSRPPRTLIPVNPDM